MARFMTRTVAASSGEVLEAILEAAGDLPLEAASVDRRSGEIRFRRPYGRRGESRRLLVSVTDNGRGGTTLHASWDDDFPARVATRRAVLRLCQRTRELVA
jgi:hypothetical protein